MAEPRDYGAEISKVIKLLSARKFDRHSEPGARIFENAVKWMTNFPSSIPNWEQRKQELFKAICSSFSVSESALQAAIVGIALPTAETLQSIKHAQGDEEMWQAIPRGGWFENYANYTMETESPLSYHMFMSLVLLGTCLGRRVYFDMGFFKIYPNFPVILIGPTGRVKKTSAIDVATNIIRELEICPVMAEKVTPEALATALQESGQQLIYAPEFSSTFNRQKYNEGLITTIIRLLDCPDRFVIRTQTRGEEVVEDVALSVVGGTTMSLLIGSSPDAVTSSGFLNRFVPVLEHGTDRVFPLPRRGSRQLLEKLYEDIEWMRQQTNVVDMHADTLKLYDEWYRERRSFLSGRADEITVEILERGHVHLLRTAMLIHLVQCKSKSVCTTCFKHAVSMMTYAESRIPALVQQMTQVSTAHDADFILQKMLAMQGIADHSRLLRAVQHRMDAANFKRHMTTLIESGRVREEKRMSTKFYVLVVGQEVR